MAKNYEHSRFLESFYIKYYNSHNSKYGYNLKIEAENDLEFIADHTKDLLRLSTYKQKMNKFRGFLGTNVEISGLSGLLMISLFLTKDLKKGKRRKNVETCFLYIFTKKTQYYCGQII